MIVRILTDNQYRLPDEHAHTIDEMDTQLLAALDSGDDAAFTSKLQQLIAYVREHGTRVPDEELVASDAIIPAPDMTLAETRERLARADVHMPTE